MTIKQVTMKINRVFPLKAIVVSTAFFVAGIRSIIGGNQGEQR